VLYQEAQIYVELMSLSTTTAVGKNCFELLWKRWAATVISELLADVSLGSRHCLVNSF